MLRVTIRVELPEPLRRWCEGAAAVDLEGESVGELLRDLAARFPATRGTLLDEGSRLQPHLVVILNDRVLERGTEMGAPLRAGDRVRLFTAASGG